MKNHFFVPTIAVGFMGAVSTGAIAQGAAEGSEWSMLQTVLDAFRAGQSSLAAMLALVLLAAVASKYGAKKIPFLSTGAGKALIVLVGSFGGAAASALVGGATMSLAIAMTALMVAVKAAGGYSLIKSLIIEPLTPYMDKAPAWLKTPFALVAWIFSGSGAIQKAEAAGQAAVDAEVPPVSEFKDVP